MITNAKDELLKAKGTKVIICASIKIGCPYGISEQVEVNLRIGHTLEEWAAFLIELNVEYNSGYGGQELYGNVWFKDGTWLERGEYDGSEWWEHKVCPKIPVELGGDENEQG